MIDAWQCWHGGGVHGASVHALFFFSPRRVWWLCLHFQQTTLLVFPHRTLTEINKSSPCNSLCHCNSRKYEPVCGVDQISYFSPCHAGCTVRVKDRKKRSKNNLLDIEQVGGQLNLYKQSLVLWPGSNSEISWVIYQARRIVFRYKHRKWIGKNEEQQSVFFKPNTGWWKTIANVWHSLSNHSQLFFTNFSFCFVFDFNVINYKFINLRGVT